MPFVNEFIYPVRVHVEDVDFGGIVYHANYLNYMERARSEWFDQLGYGIMGQWEQDVFLPLYSIQIFFLHPARLHEQLEVVSKVKEVGAASIVFDQYLRLALSKDKIICKAEIKLACVNRAMQPQKWPKASIVETIRRTLT